MKTRSVLMAATLIAVLFGFGQPAQAKTHDGHITLLQAPGWLGATSVAGIGGTDTVTGKSFFAACYADRALVAAGQAPVFVDQLVASPINGLDAFIIDLKKETMGAFAVKGPGATGVGPEVQGIQVTSYDLDLDFFVDPTVDATAATTSGCNDANEKATGNSSNKCYSHKPMPDEKTSCISGYKAANGKTHGARYLMVSAGLNLVGPMDIKVTTP